MGGSRFWNLAMKRLRGSPVGGSGGDRAWPLLLLLVVASITAVIKSMRHPNVFVHFGDSHLQVLGSHRVNVSH